LRKDRAAALVFASRPDEALLGKWVRDRTTGLADAMNGRRDAKVRDVLAAYVE